MGKLKSPAMPGIALGAIAVAIALGSTSLASEDAGKAVKTGKQLKYVPVTFNLPQQGVNNGIAEATANCGSRKKFLVVGGGATVANASPTESEYLMESGLQANGWHARLDNDTNQIQGAAVTAICLVKK